MGRNIGQSFSTGKAKDSPGILLFISRRVFIKKVIFSIENTVVTLYCHGIICAQRPPVILGSCLSSFKVQHQHTPPFIIITITDTRSALEIEISKSLEGQFK